MRRASRRIAGLMMVGLTAGCVGGEGEGVEEGAAGVSEAAARAERAMTRPGWDTIEPAHYQVFERLYSADSTRVLTRFLVLEKANGDVLSKTLRLALDSLGKADSSLVAARGILYTAVPRSTERAAAVPTIWGEWVPPGGWGATPQPGEDVIHRTHIYRMDPGWNRTDTASTAEAGNG